MPGFSLFKDFVMADVGPDLVPPVDLFKSLNTVTECPYACDPLVLAVQNSVNRLRKLAAADISASYLVSAVVAGIWGFCPSQVATDDSGNTIPVPSQVSIAGNVAPIYPVPTMQPYATPDLVTGTLRSSAYSCRNLIAGGLWENTTITDQFVGTMVGILISTIGSNAPVFFWSTAAAVKVGRVKAVDNQSPYFNTTLTANVQDTTHYNRCPIAVQIDPIYDQANQATAIYAS